MIAKQPPTLPRTMGFEEWVAYCFDREVSSPQWYWQAGVEGESDWYQPEPAVLARDLARLFSHSGRLVDLYSEAQIAQGLYFICSSGSSYFQTVRRGAVPEADQVAWVRSIRALYRDSFVRLCAHHYGHLDRGPEPARPLNTLCYMFWDLDGIEGAAMFPGEEHLVEPIFEALAFALALAHPACIESALHGLGHLAFAHPQRVARLIGHCLATTDNLPDELRAYARAAATGCIP